MNDGIYADNNTDSYVAIQKGNIISRISRHCNRKVIKIWMDRYRMYLGIWVEPINQ